MEIPYILLQTILYGVITYFMIDFERTTGMVTALFDSLFKLQNVLQNK